MWQKTHFYPFIWLVDYMTRNIKKTEVLYFVFLLFFALGLIIGKGFTSAFKKGLLLWVSVVLPSLFPYTFISASLCRMGLTGKLSIKAEPLTKRLFRTSGVTCYALFISLIAGYPMGSKTVADLRKDGLITEVEAQRASAFCSVPSPAFIIYGVGMGMFNNLKFGYLLFLSQIISSLTVGFIFSFYKRKQTPSFKPLPSKKVDNLFYESVFSTVNSVLFVGAIISLFSVLAEMLIYFKILYPLTNVLALLLKSQSLAKGSVLGLIECTNGLKAMASGGITFLTLPISAFLCGFGGACVLIQSIAFLNSAKIKTAPFLLAKVMQAVISFFVCLLFNLFL